MVNHGGFKADNDFKSGDLQHLEQVLKQMLPESGILGKPHIESKLKVMKKDWKIVYDMLNVNTSGFGYDSVTRTVVAEDDAWDSYVKVHKRASKWRNKTLPRYADLCIVFGKDRAQGNQARDVMHMEVEINNEAQNENLDDDFDDVMDSINNPFTRSSGPNERTSSSRGKKRKHHPDPLVQAFNDASIRIDKSIRDMSKKMIRDVKRVEEVDKKREKMIGEIMKMSLTNDEKYKAIKVTRDDDGSVKDFWVLDEANREDWVKFIIKD